VRQPATVFVLPRFHQRRRLVPRPGGPWLRVPPPSWRAVLLGVGVWGVCFLAMPGLRVFLAWVVPVWGFCLLCAFLTRRSYQICPKCLRDMAVTATRCPWCRFDAQEHP
jgi:hypothetical protein